MSDFLSQINAMSDDEFDRLEAILIWTTERARERERAEAEALGECVHGISLVPGGECRWCFREEFTSQRDFDARDDL